MKTLHQPKQGKFEPSSACTSTYTFQPFARAKANAEYDLDTFHCPGITMVGVGGWVGVLGRQKSEWKAGTHSITNYHTMQMCSTLKPVWPFPPCSLHVPGGQSLGLGPRRLAVHWFHHHPGQQHLYRYLSGKLDDTL